MPSNKKDTLTEKEMRLLALSWQCMDSQPSIDYDKLAAISGYTRGSAATIFKTIKGKIRRMAAAEANDETTDQAGLGTPNKRKTDSNTPPAKRSRNTKNQTGDAGSPSKGQRPSKLPSFTPINATNDDDEEPVDFDMILKPDPDADDGATTNNTII